MHAEWLDPAALACVEPVKGDGVAAPAERALMAPAVAAALAEADDPTHPGSLDLLPPPDRKRRFPLLSPSVVVPALLTLFLTAGLGTWDWLVRRQAARLTYVVSHPTAAMLECSRLQARESQLRERCRNATLLLQSAPRRASMAFVAELPRRLPKEVWLERLDIGADGACVIEGMAHAEDPVFSFADSLRSSPYVASVQMGGTGNEREGGVILTRFRLNLALTMHTEPAEEGAQK